MPAIGLSREEYEAVFGPRDVEASGRSRLCRVCGNWHPLNRPIPHNCRSEAPPRADLAAPMIAPPFQPFKTGVLDDASSITNRAEKREYMERNDLVEYDAGVQPDREPTMREWQEEFVSDFKRVMETDPLNRPPVERIGETETDGAGEIATDDLQVFND